VDCDSPDEHAAANRGLVLGWDLIGDAGLFDGDIGKLRRIKYFSTGLAFDEFCIVLAGDDLDDGMFALWGHEFKGEWYGFCPSRSGLSR
jgi:hypothetical protein